MMGELLGGRIEKWQVSLILRCLNLKRLAALVVAAWTSQLDVRHSIRNEINIFTDEDFSRDPGDRFGSVFMEGESLIDYRK